MSKATGNKGLTHAKAAQQDEFYTQFGDIQAEMNAYLDYAPDVFRGKTILLPCDDPEWSNFTKFFILNFKRFGLKKLISTSYAVNSKPFTGVYQPSLFEQNSPQYNPESSLTKGKIFTLTKGAPGSANPTVNSLKWKYLEGDGDFRSEEVCKLRDEADIIVTNPPFSLARDFFKWLFVSCKKFIIVGNMNAITYKEVFPLVKENKMWLGESIHSGDREFQVPDDYPLYAAGCRTDEHGKKFIRVKGVRWYTNLEHGRRHQPLMLMTKQQNIKHSKHPEVKGIGYLKYDNYDAIEVPFTDAIPSDHDGCMGVPISLLDKYCPEQFEILDARDYAKSDRLRGKSTYLIKDADSAIDGKARYARIVIRAVNN